MIQPTSRRGDYTMKKIALSMLAAVLLLTLVFGTAFAVTGDMTIKAAKAYADPNMTKYIGTIPKYTSVLVRAYGSYADVYVNGVECFIKPSVLCILCNFSNIRFHYATKFFPKNCLKYANWN